MTEAEKQSWQKVRARGRWRFILMQGILRFGLVFAAWLALLDYFVHHKANPPFLDTVLEIIIFTLIAGYVFGEARWRISEYKYQLPKKSAPEK